MTPKIPAVDRFAQCRELCLHGRPHDAESLKVYNAERAREYARGDARRAPHPQIPLAGVR